MTSKEGATGPVLPSAITAETTYFPFMSGRLTYDCATCDAACCRGHGYLLNRQAEGNLHFNSRRNLHLFVDPVNTNAISPAVQIRNCPPACFFLTEDGLCDIHLRHGYASKPETCRLFPFNYFRRVGNLLVVSPHSQLCPLGVSPLGVFDEKSRHESLLRDLQSAGITAPVPHYEPVDQWPIEEAVALERKVLLASETYEAAASYIQFAALQLNLTSSLAYAGVDTIAEGSALDSMRKFSQTFQHLLGISVSSNDAPGADLVRLMVVLTPFLRSQFLFRPWSKHDMSKANASFLRIPYVLAGIHLLACATRVAGMSAITVQTIFSLSATFSSLLLFLSNCNTPMAWRPDVKVPVSFPGRRDFRASYVRVAKALLPMRQRRLTIPLGDVLTEHTAGFEETERVRFLTLLAGILAGKIVSVSEVDRMHTGFWRTVTSALHKSAFAAADESLLTAIASRRAT